MKIKKYFPAIIGVCLLGLALYFMAKSTNVPDYSDSTAFLGTQLLSKNSTMPTDITGLFNAGQPLVIWYEPSNQMNAVEITLTVKYPNGETVDFNFVIAPPHSIAKYCSSEAWSIPSWAILYTFTFEIYTSEDKIITDTFYASLLVR